MIAEPGRGHLANPTNIFDGTPKTKEPSSLAMGEKGAGRKDCAF